MLKYTLQRILLLIPILIGVSFIIFTIMSLKPGDPALIILGGEASSPQALQKVREDLGLNKPFVIRYLNYMKGAVHGDLGVSYRNGSNVMDEILARFPVTLKLAIFSMLLVSLLGVPIGILSAIKQYSLIDMISVVAALLLAAMPSFWIGLMLILLFSVKLGMLPATGSSTIVNYILPSITLAAVNMAVVTRMTRSTMLEVVRQDYVRTARGKGANGTRIIINHCLKNAMIPVLTTVAIQFGKLIGGAVLVETVFAMPGLGTLLVDAIRMNDIPLIMGSVMCLAIVFTVINLIIDLLYAFIDPRIKAQYARS